MLDYIPAEGRRKILGATVFSGAAFAVCGIFYYCARYVLPLGSFAGMIAAGLSFMGLAFGIVSLAPLGGAIAVLYTGSALEDADLFAAKSLPQKIVSLTLLCLLFAWWYFEDLRDGMQPAQDAPQLVLALGLYLVYYCLQNAVWRFFGSFFTKDKGRL